MEAKVDLVFYYAQRGRYCHSQVCLTLRTASFRMFGSGPVACLVEFGLCSSFYLAEFFRRPSFPTYFGPRLSSSGMVFENYSISEMVFSLLTYSSRANFALAPYRAVGFKASTLLNGGTCSPSCSLNEGLQGSLQIGDENLRVPTLLFGDNFPSPPKALVIFRTSLLLLTDGNWLFFPFSKFGALQHVC